MITFFSIENVCADSSIAEESRTLTSRIAMVKSISRADSVFKKTPSEFDSRNDKNRHARTSWMT